MTHKFAVIIEKYFYYKIQNNNNFYLRILVLDVIRALVDEKQSANKYHNELFYKCSQNIASKIKIFENKNSIIFYLELNDGFFENFFEEPLDNPE